MSLPPTYDQSNENISKDGSGGGGKQKPYDFDDDLPNLPSVPDSHLNNTNTNNTANDHSQSIDFDELSRRFENLKSKK